MDRIQIDRIGNKKVLRMENDLIPGVGGLKLYPVNGFGITVEATHFLLPDLDSTTGIFTMTYEQAEVLRQYLNENRDMHDSAIGSRQDVE